MLLFTVLVVAVLLFAIAAVAAGRGDPLAEAPADHADLGLPEDRRLASWDVPRLRFRVGLRGYRMSDVDAALDRLRDSLAQLESLAGEPLRPEPVAEPSEPLRPEPVPEPLPEPAPGPLEPMQPEPPLPGPVPGPPPPQPGPAPVPMPPSPPSPPPPPGPPPPPLSRR